MLIGRFSKILCVMYPRYYLWPQVLLLQYHQKMFPTSSFIDSFILTSCGQVDKVYSNHISSMVHARSPAWCCKEQTLKSHLFRNLSLCSSWWVMLLYIKAFYLHENQSPSQCCVIHTFTFTFTVTRCWQEFCARLQVLTHSHTDNKGIRSSQRFSFLVRDTSTQTLLEPVIEPVTFWLPVMHHEA